MESGIVVKVLGGFYFVRTNNGEEKRCFLRGRLKREHNVIVGDQVRLAKIDSESGVIEEVLPRKSELKRPPVANVDQVVIVFAAKSPDPNFTLLDRFLVLTEQANLKAVICINKVDLVEMDAVREQFSCYQQIGYPLLFTSTKAGIGISDLRNLLHDKLTVFAGPSGVGKSALLNAIQPGFALRTGDVSVKIGRGRHTTRCVELLSLTGGGLVVDTPGFSLLELAIAPEALINFFPDLAVYKADCEFADCRHNETPDCGLTKALAAGKINPQRYLRYREFLQEILKGEQ